MTAWELLLTYSTAPDGSTAWEHLNAQEGGGLGTGETIYIVEELFLDEGTVNIDIDDMIPVSTVEEIKVDVVEILVEGSV